MPSTDGKEQQTQSVWERLQKRFSRDRGVDDAFGEHPPHRGWAIAICTLISVFLWFVFTMQESYTTSVAFPTQVVNVPAEQALTTLPPRRVQVQVTGQGFPLLQLKYNTPTIPINANAQQLNLTKAIPDLPKSISLESVSPSTIQLHTEPQSTRTVPIIPNTNIKTPSTHDLVKPPSITPDSVKVAGGRSIIDDLKGWPTEKFERRGLKDSITVEVPLADTLRGLTERSVQSVRLTAIARRFTEGTRTINVTVTGEPSNEKWVTLEPSKVHVTYRVLFDQYETAQQAPDFYATVSYDEIRSDTTGRIRPRLHLPEDALLRDVEMRPSSLRYYNFLQ